MSANPDITHHDWQVVAYDKNDRLVLNTRINGKTLEEVADWCTTHPNFEDWDHYDHKRIPKT